MLLIELVELQKQKINLQIQSDMCSCLFYLISLLQEERKAQKDEEKWIFFEI
jgi:hypothetical protein